MIPIEYHRYARVIVQERIQAGEAAARRERANPATAAHLHQPRGPRSLRAWLLARLRTPLPPGVATRNV